MTHEMKPREIPKQQVFRDVVVLQVKLVVDGFRDLVLVPVSLVAALVDLFDSSHVPGYHFYRVVRFGRETERYIHLFESADRVAPSEPDQFGLEGRQLDTLIGEVESQLRDQVDDDAELERNIRTRLKDLLDELKRARGERAAPDDD